MSTLDLTSRLIELKRDENPVFWMYNVVIFNDEICKYMTGYTDIEAHSWQIFLS